LTRNSRYALLRNELGHFRLAACAFQKYLAFRAAEADHIRLLQEFSPKESDMGAIRLGFVFGIIGGTVSVAGATPVTVDFEGLTAMTFFTGNPVPIAARLSNEYASTKGIVFSSGSPYIAVVSLGGGHATSGVNGFGGTSAGGLLDYGAPVTFTFVWPGNSSVPAVTDFVSVRGDLHGGGGTTTLHAYDLAGTELGHVTLTDTGGTTWSISAPGIHSARWDGSPDPAGSGIAQDDVSFNPVIAVPEPMGAALVGAASGLGLAMRRRRAAT
jgi:hypothetical protein